MLSKKLINKITKYAKLRGGDSYNDSDPQRLITAFENGTKQWQETWEEGMDIYLRKIKEGTVLKGMRVTK
jgi:hypothetical protein